MRCKLSVAIILMVTLSLCIIPAISDDSSAVSSVTVKNATISSFDNNIDIKAGQTLTVTVDVYNGGADTIVAGIKITSPSVSVTSDKSEITVDKNKVSTFTLTISTDRLMDHGSYQFTADFTVYAFEDSGYDTGALNFAVTVSSQFSDGSGYNRIMGVFDPLPAPFDSVAATVIITLLLWSLISIFAVLLLMAVVHFVFRSDKGIRSSVDKGTGSMLAIAIMIHGISNSLAVAGGSADASDAAGETLPDDNIAQYAGGSDDE